MDEINFNCFEVGCNGGYRVILELASRLSLRGFSVSISSVAPKMETAWFQGDLRKIRFKIAFPSKAERLIKQRLLKTNWRLVQAELLRKITPKHAVNIATACLTAEPTSRGNGGRGFYLVQNYEPWFYTEPLIQRKAEESYELPLLKVCVSDWLAEKVGGVCIGSGVNTEVFRCYNSFEGKEPNSVMYLYRGVPWKGDITALELLEKLYKADSTVRVHVVLAGMDSKVMPKINFPYKLHTHLADSELAKLYAKCRVLLYTTTFEGKGLPPLEALACGTNVASTAFFGNDYLEFGKNCSYATVADILELMRNDDLALQQLRSGFETVKRHDFTKVVDNLCELVDKNHE